MSCNSNTSLSFYWTRITYQLRSSISRIKTSKTWSLSNMIEKTWDTFTSATSTLTTHRCLLPHHDPPPSHQARTRPHHHLFSGAGAHLRCTLTLIFGRSLQLNRLMALLQTGTRQRKLRNSRIHRSTSLEIPLPRYLLHQSPTSRSANSRHQYIYSAYYRRLPARKLIVSSSSFSTSRPKSCAVYCACQTRRSACTCSSCSRARYRTVAESGDKATCESLRPSICTVNQSYATSGWQACTTAMLKAKSTMLFPWNGHFGA